MGRRPRPDLTAHRQELARLIDDALNVGQRGNGSRPRGWESWTNQAFAEKAGSWESDVRGWRNQSNPVRPKMIIPLLEVFFGNRSEYAAARQAMLIAWRRAGGIRSEEPAPPPVRAIETKQFSELAEIVDLSVSQPTPDNNGNLIVPFTLRIHPDTNCEVDGNSVEIGIGPAYAVIESEQWKPAADTVFRGKPHTYTGKTAAAGTALLVGPTDDKGRLDGQPLADTPNVTLEPRAQDADGPIEVSIRVAREGFKVTPHGHADVTGTQKAVLDALFADSFPRDKKHRLKVASETVRSRAVKATE
jgi:hypothetical protein